MPLYAGKYAICTFFAKYAKYAASSHARYKPVSLIVDFPRTAKHLGQTKNILDTGAPVRFVCLSKHNINP